MTPQLSITLPPSKSLYNRLFVMARLAHLPIPSLWRQLDLCEDLAVMLHASGSSEGRISVGASGTAMRLLTALFALTTEREVLLVSPIHRMTERPLAQLITLLSQLGADIAQPSSQEPVEGLYPLVRIRPMNPQQKGLLPTLTLPSGLESSQTVTALLLIAPYLSHGLALRWQDDQLPSASYIQLTCALMQSCGIDLSLDRHGIHVAPGAYCEAMLTRLLSNPIGDWSSAQYPLQWALMTPRPCQLLLTNVPAQSLQPDARALELLQISPEWLSAGDDTLCFDSEFLQKHLRKLTFGSLSLSNNPDFAPTLIALLLYYQKKAQLRGLDHLRLKESDRIALILHNGEQLGYQLSYETESGFCLAGSAPSSVHTPVPIATDADHRMVMAWAPFAWYHQLQIETPQAVDKSYPTFWRDLRKLCEIIATPLYMSPHCHDYDL